jgi:predicted nucleotidyltransferase
MCREYSIMQITDNQTTDLVHRIVNAARPLRIILFGSAARGDDSPGSDVDILVVVPDGVHRRRTAQDIYLALLGFGAPVDIIVATVSDLEKYSDSPGLIYREALREGRVLYAA